MKKIGWEISPKINFLQFSLKLRPISMQNYFNKINIFFNKALTDLIF